MNFGYGPSGFLPNECKFFSSGDCNKKMKLKINEMSKSQDRSLVN